MPKVAKKFWKWICTLNDVRDIGQLAFSGNLSVLTACLAYLKDAPWHLIIFYFTGVLAFTAVAWSYFKDNLNKNNLIGAIITQNFRIPNLNKNPDDNTVGINCEFDVVNRSDKTIFVKINDVQYSIDNRTKQEQTISPHIIVLPSKTFNGCALPTISKLEIKANYQGRLKISYEYGFSQDRMNWVFMADIDLTYVIGEAVSGGTSTIVNSRFREVKWIKI